MKWPDAEKFDEATQFTAGELGKWMERAAVNGGLRETEARRLLLLGSMVLMKFPQARVILDAGDFSQRMQQLYPMGEEVDKLRAANEALDKQNTRLLARIVEAEKKLGGGP